MFGWKYSSSQLEERSFVAHRGQCPRYLLGVKLQGVALHTMGCSEEYAQE
jgi:hypothetical protein